MGSSYIEIKHELRDTRSGFLERRRRLRVPGGFGLYILMERVLSESLVTFY